ncbi:serine protease [Priestia megaterium]|uniref:S1 family peptidase n=1 Tax=Priestia megaterium TaxID=1404 RepID=UPI00339801F4
MLNVTEQFLYSTVRIECTHLDGGISTGTGFFFRFLDDGQTNFPAIVTNKHVVEQAITGKILMTLRDDDGNPINTEHLTIELENFEHMWIFHPDPEVDICIMPLGPILEQARSLQKNVFYVSLHRDLLPSAEELSQLRAIENITMVGYPSGLWDRINNFPIIRRGITATHPNINYNGKEEILIDAACFPGSSGSPVFIYDDNGYTTKDGNTHMGGSRVFLLGILYAGPQFTARGEIAVMNIPGSPRPIPVSQIPMNLGCVIKSQKLLDFEEIILQNFQRQ